MVVRTSEGCREVEEMCLKHSCPQGSVYPKHGPPSSQFDFVSLTNDITLAGTSIIEGRRCPGECARL